MRKFEKIEKKALMSALFHAHRATAIADARGDALAAQLAGLKKRVRDLRADEEANAETLGEVRVALGLDPDSVIVLSSLIASKLELVDELRREVMGLRAARDSAEANRAALLQVYEELKDERDLYKRELEELKGALECARREL